MNSQEKLIIIKEIFQYISKLMLETSYALNLGKLLKISFKIKKYLWQKLKLNKTQNLRKTTTKKQVSSSTPKVGTIVVIIDNHMVIIQV